MTLLKSILDLDLRISTRLRVAEKPGPLRSAAIFFAHSGDSWFWGAALIAVWITASASWKDWAAIQFISIALLAVLVLLIKFSIRRRRPEGEWGAIYRSTDPHSFPSGHAARAFLIAVLAAGLGPGWLAAILWVWAPIVSLARVAMGVHYLSDVAAGALLGLVMGLVCLQLSGWMLVVLANLLRLLG
ncbi:MAG: phosphatase PAP2 family protein [Bacteroidota bacterium]